MFAKKKENPSTGNTPNTENTRALSDREKLVKERTQDLLSRELAIPTLEYTARVCSVHAGLAFAFGNCERSAEHDTDLSGARPLVEFCYSILEPSKERTTMHESMISHAALDSDPVLKLLWKMLSENMVALHEKNIFADDKEFEFLVFSALIRSLSNSFRLVVDKILAKWDRLCSCRETYAVLGALLSIHEREKGANIDFEAFVDMLKEFCPALTQYT